jgi:hypothetical protein
MIVYRDLNIDEWWVYENGEWWHGRGWKPSGFEWKRVSQGPSPQMLCEEEIIQVEEGNFHNAKGFPIVLK